MLQPYFGLFEATKVKDAFNMSLHKIFIISDITCRLGLSIDIIYHKVGGQ